jgi:hypothetical protein
MYWKFIENFTAGSYILLQTSTGTGINIDISLLQIFVGIIIGLVPGIITAFVAKQKWEQGEKAVVGSQANLNQTLAIENIATAATMITTQAQALNEKSSALIAVLEAEVNRQKGIIDHERELYEALEDDYRREVEGLKIEIAVIKEQISQCSIQLKRIVTDLRDGNPISDDCLDRLEELIEKVYVV